MMRVLVVALACGHASIVSGLRVECRSKDDPTGRMGIPTSSDDTTPGGVLTSSATADFEILDALNVNATTLDAQNDATHRQILDGKQQCQSLILEPTAIANFQESSGRKWGQVNSYADLGEPPQEKSDGSTVIASYPHRNAFYRGELTAQTPPGLLYLDSTVMSVSGPDHESAAHHQTIALTQPGLQGLIDPAQSGTDVAKISLTSLKRDSLVLKYSFEGFVKILSYSFTCLPPQLTQGQQHAGFPRKWILWDQHGSILDMRGGIQGDTGAGSSFPGGVTAAAQWQALGRLVDDFELDALIARLTPQLTEDMADEPRP